MLSKLPNILALALALKSTLSLALPQARDSTKHATYFLQIDPAGDYVVALSNNEDNGTVSSPVRTPTGGKGLAGLLAISQDSLVVSQDVCSSLIFVTFKHRVLTVRLYKVPFRC